MIEIVLLDIGGVLVELGGVAAIQRLLGPHLSADEVHGIWGESEAVRLHETGRIDAPTFAAQLVEELALPLSPVAFLEEFGNWPTRLHPEALEMIEAIPARFRVSALSNLSDLHWSRIGGDLGLNGRFHAHYFSHELGCMKPDPRIFELVLADLNVPAGGVLFIDDSPGNVSAACEAGMNAQVARNSSEARTVLGRCGVL